MMRKMLLSLCLLLASCALNLHTANEYYQGGLKNAEEGKWFNARMAFGRAWTNADLGHADDRVKAIYAYEYGRASGAICDWVESERGLLKALEYDRKTDGPIHMSLVELGSMYHAKGDLGESARYFEMAKVSLDKVQGDTRDSIGYANFLKEYAVVLSKLGKQEYARVLTSREEELRQVFRGRTSRWELTPYGEYCDQKSLTIRSTRTLHADARTPVT